MSTNNGKSMKMEDLGYGLTREWLLKNYIVVYTARQDSYAALDLWMTTVIKDIQNWDYARPYLALHDFAHTQFSVELRNATERIAACYPEDYHGRYAVVVSFGVRGRVVSYLENWKHQRQVSGAFDGSYFHSTDLALQWLKEGIPVGV